MNIAVDTTPIDPKVDSAHKVRGVGMYISQLVNGLKKFDTKNAYEFFSGGVVPTHADLVHFPYFDLFFHTVNFPRDKKVVVTLHDLTPLKFPKEFPVGLKGKFRWEKNKRLLRKADAIITDSQSSKIDIEKLAGIHPGKIHTVYLAVEEAFQKLDSGAWITELRAKYSLPDKFLLYVGDVTWNKNLPRIMAACKIAQFPLVLVGKAVLEKNIDSANPWNKDLVKVQDLLRRDDPLFHALGFVSTEDLVRLYNLAQALLMPSMYEGFGLPVLEAMRSGCPVITSHEGSLPEVARDAAIYVDPYSQSDITKSINQVLSSQDQRVQMSQKGLEQAKKFSLEKMIQETVRVYQAL